MSKTREKINITEILDGNWSFEDAEGYKVIEETIDYFDSEKGYTEKTVIIQRLSDNKYFSYQYEEWGQGSNNLEDGIEGEEVFPISKTITVYE